jgi:competence protein ComEC
VFGGFDGWRLTSAIVAGSIGAWVGLPKSEVPTVRFLDVGQGDATLYSVGDRQILIDVGADGFRVVSQLKKLRVARLDLVVLTHFDNDHVGGVREVAVAYPQARFLVASHFLRDEAYVEMVSSWNLGARLITLDESRELRLGSARMHFGILPWQPRLSDNEGSIANRFCIAQSCVVGTGDLGAASESILAAQGDWNAEVVKAGHHGSGGSTSDEWLRAVGPNTVVISSGRRNPFRHPAKPTLDRIAAVGAKAIRTDQSGTITFVHRDGRWTLR